MPIFNKNQQRSRSSEHQVLDACWALFGLLDRQAAGSFERREPPRSKADVVAPSAIRCREKPPRGRPVRNFDGSEDFDAEDLQARYGALRNCTLQAGLWANG